MAPGALALANEEAQTLQLPLGEQPGGIGSTGQCIGVGIAGGKVVVYTRNGHDWTEQFRVILEPLRRLMKGSALIDGEIVAIDSAGRTAHP